ncbi:hypothetical protein P7K49_031474, partial [Saguinus oedipus]
AADGAFPDPWQRLRAAPSVDAAPSLDPAPGRPRSGAGQMWRPLASQEGLEAGEARGGPRRPRKAAQEAGSRPERVHARGCRPSVRA